MGGAGDYHLYEGFTGPSAFGTGEDEVFATSSIGDLVGINGGNRQLAVPSDYVSGAPLLDSAIWTGSSFTSLGITPGTYVYSWGSGPTASTFTIIAESTAVPEPAPSFVLVLGIVALALCLRPRPKQA